MNSCRRRKRIYRPEATVCTTHKSLWRYADASYRVKTLWLNVPQHQCGFVLTPSLLCLSTHTFSQYNTSNLQHSPSPNTFMDQSSHSIIHQRDGGYNIQTPPPYQKQECIPHAFVAAVRSVSWFFSCHVLIGASITQYTRESLILSNPSKCLYVNTFIILCLFCLYLLSWQLGSATDSVTDAHPRWALNWIGRRHGRTAQAPISLPSSQWARAISCHENTTAGIFYGLICCNE